MGGGAVPFAGCAFLSSVIGSGRLRRVGEAQAGNARLSGPAWSLFTLNAAGSARLATVSWNSLLATLRARATTLRPRRVVQSRSPKSTSRPAEVRLGTDSR